MRKFLIYCTFFSFFIYWGTTFLYVAPKNHISDSLFEKNDGIRYLFSQNWSLFVPPPTNNNKLYYTFHKKGSDEIHTFEVLASLLKLKSGNAPFNTSESIQDRILTGSQNSIVWWVENHQENMDLQICPVDEAQIKTEEQRAKETMDFIQTTYHFQVLKRFSLFVAEQNNIPIQDYYVSFSLVGIDVPEFEDRKNLIDEAFVFQEKILFESEKFSIVP